MFNRYYIIVFVQKVTCIIYNNLAIISLWWFTIAESREKIDDCEAQQYIPYAVSSGIPLQGKLINEEWLSCNEIISPNRFAMNIWDVNIHRLNLSNFVSLCKQLEVLTIQKHPHYRIKIGNTVWHELALMEWSWKQAKNIQFFNVWVFTPIVG